MRVLLIEPRSCWRGINVGLAYVAAILKEAGHEVKGVNLSEHREYCPLRLQRYFVKTFAPDLVGYSIVYTSVYSMAEELRDLRTYYQGPVMVGGPQMGIERGQILQDYPDLDYAFVGETERSLPAFCEALSAGGPYDKIPGLAYREGRSIRVNEPAKPNRELDQIPFPDYHAFGLKHVHTYLLSSSRGCPYRCTFCFRNSNVWRARSPESLVEELRSAVEQYGIKEFCIADDSFNVKPDRIIEFCRLYRESGIGLPWYCSGARADRLPDELITALRTSGCQFLGVGIETLQPDVFARINKGESLNQILDAIRRLKKHGIKPFGYFMIGLPGDTPEGVMDTFWQASRLGLDHIGFSLLLPFPGTDIHRQISEDRTVRWLEDYRRVSTVWTYDPEWSTLRVSFDTPAFDAQAKIHLANKINVLQGNPRAPYDGSKMRFALNTLYFIFRYGGVRSPSILFRTLWRVAKRLLRSRGTSLSRALTSYQPDYLPTSAEMDRVLGPRQGDSQVYKAE